MTNALDLSYLRSLYPSLALYVHGQPAVFLDNPGGTQVPQAVIDAVSAYYTQSNANHGGAFLTSQRSDAILDDAHQAVAGMRPVDGVEDEKPADSEVKRPAVLLNLFLGGGDEKPIRVIEGQARTAGAPTRLAGEVVKAIAEPGSGQ